VKIMTTFDEFNSLDVHKMEGMTIIDELSSWGVQKLEIDIIVRCWENDICPYKIADIMGKAFSVEDIQRVIAHFREKKEAEARANIEPFLDEDVIRSIRLLKFYEHEVNPSMLSELFGFPLEKVEKLIQEH
jgi:hypothetical protein